MRSKKTTIPATHINKNDIHSFIFRNKGIKIYKKKYDCYIDFNDFFLCSEIDNPKELIKEGTDYLSHILIEGRKTKTPVIKWAEAQELLTIVINTTDNFVLENTCKDLQRYLITKLKEIKETETYIKMIETAPKVEVVFPLEQSDEIIDFANNKAIHSVKYKDDVLVLYEYKFNVYCFAVSLQKVCGIKQPKVYLKKYCKNPKEFTVVHYGEENKKVKTQALSWEDTQEYVYNSKLAPSEKKNLLSFLSVEFNRVNKYGVHKITVDLSGINMEIEETIEKDILDEGIFKLKVNNWDIKMFEEGGEQWFCCVDVKEAFHINHPKYSYRHLCAETKKRKCNHLTPSGKKQNREVFFTNRSGCLELANEDRLDKAYEAVEKWLSKVPSCTTPKEEKKESVIVKDLSKLAEIKSYDTKTNEIKTIEGNVWVPTYTALFNNPNVIKIPEKNDYMENLGIENYINVWFDGSWWGVPTDIPSYEIDDKVTRCLKAAQEAMVSQKKEVKRKSESDKIIRELTVRERRILTELNTARAKKIAMFPTTSLKTVANMFINCRVPDVTKALKEDGFLFFDENKHCWDVVAEKRYLNLGEAEPKYDKEKDEHYYMFLMTDSGVSLALDSLYKRGFEIDESKLNPVYDQLLDL